MRPAGTRPGVASPAARAGEAHQGENMKAITGPVAVFIAVLLAGCGSSPPPTPYQRFVESMARVGLHPERGQSWEIARVKKVCGVLARDAEDSPGETDLVFPAAVTAVEQNGNTEAQASAFVRAVIDDFCPQWKVLLRQ